MSKIALEHAYFRLSYSFLSRKSSTMRYTYPEAQMIAIIVNTIISFSRNFYPAPISLLKAIRPMSINKKVTISDDLSLLAVRWGWTALTLCCFLFIRKCSPAHLRVPFTRRRTLFPRVQISFRLIIKQKKHLFRCFLFYWRRGRDSNSGRGRPLDGFQDRCIKPLCHLSIFILLKPGVETVFRNYVSTTVLLSSPIKELPRTLSTLRYDSKTAALNHSATSPSLFY